MRNLSTTGLSMSDAQTISNLCNQAAMSIDKKLKYVNNHEETLDLSGKINILQKGVSMPENVIELLIKKTQLHGCQAYLREAMKLKENLMNHERQRTFVFNKELPRAPDRMYPELIPIVTETWGWNQLTDTEYNEYLKYEAVASHIGQFIHDGSILDKLREQLPTIPTVKWFERKDLVLPITIVVHHKMENLDKLHLELAKLHRGAEKIVNKYKAKVKNLVAKKNHEINLENRAAQETSQKEYEDLYKVYLKKYEEYVTEQKAEKLKFDDEVATKISEYSTLKIVSLPEYKDIIEEFIG